MTQTTSPLAKVVARPQTTIPRRKQLEPWGLCVHTTGSGVPSKALVGEDPVDVAVRYYTQPDSNFPHYVIGYGGDLHSICDESLRARHAGGLTDEMRASYADGSWQTKVSAEGVQYWVLRWSGMKGPADLHPSASANEDYIGVELVPLLHPLDDGSLFTDEQYVSLRALIADIESRYNIQLSGGRLVGHEDLDPLQRWDAHGGWDPGALRSTPRFFWDRARSGAAPAGA